MRFAQSLGFEGFRDLQAVFHRRLGTAAPGFSARLRGRETELGGPEDRSELGFLRDLMLRDIASPREVLEGTTFDQIASAVDLVERADMVYLLGQLHSAPVGELLRYLLTMLGKRTVLLDPGGGLAIHMARAARPTDLLIEVSFRFYATEVVNVAEEAARGAPIVAISDSTLSPLAKAAVLFAVPEHDHAFSRSLAAPMCLAQALAVARAVRLQGSSQWPRSSAPRRRTQGS